MMILVPRFLIGRREARTPYGPLVPFPAVPIFKATAVLIFPAIGNRTVKVSAYGYGRISIDGRKFLISTEHSKTIKAVVRSWGLIVMRLSPEKFIGIESMEVY